MDSRSKYSKEVRTVRLCVVDKGRISACIHLLLDDTGNIHVSTLGNIHALLYIEAVMPH